MLGFLDPDLPKRGKGVEVGAIDLDRPPTVPN
jgi:hypothetical protein